MSSRGLIHFADFGLALSAEFELSPAEQGFLSDHVRYDHDYTAGFLVHQIHRTYEGFQAAFHRRLLTTTNEAP